jgi:pimeloyl-ACP methyl ester carboxylesterase
MSIYVLVHGAWHTGDLLEPTAKIIRAAGHEVHTPTLAGNRPGQSKAVGLDDAIQSLIDYLVEKNISDTVLVGHSYGGMVIAGVADRAKERIRRLVFWNAFAPNDGESLTNLVPPHLVAIFDQIAAASGDNTVVLPPPVWREAFFNDGSAEEASACYAKLNPHPYATMTDKIRLSVNPAEMACGKSYLNFTDDSAQPCLASLPITEAWTFPSCAGARGPRSLLYQSRLAGAKNHRGWQGLKHNMRRGGRRRASY